MELQAVTSKPHSERDEIMGLWKLRRYGGNAVLGEVEANELLDAYDGLVEQLERPMYGPEGRWKELRERCDSLEEQLETYEWALRKISELRLDEGLPAERACHQARTTMQALANDALGSNPAKRPRPKFPLFESGDPDNSQKADEFFGGGSA